MIFFVKKFKCIIDDEDAELLEKYKWHVVIKTDTPYLQTSIKIDGKKRTLQLSREILNAPKDRLVDHIDGNTLDNRRNNLRLADKRTNAQNMRPNINTTSKYKGVSWDKQRMKWRAVIFHNGKQIMLGRFIDEIVAAKTYDEYALKYFGEFARLNFKPNCFELETYPT